MTAEDPMMVGAATVFVVTDLAKGTEHYRDVLGFTVAFECRTPTFYVCLCRNEVALQLFRQAIRADYPAMAASACS